MGDGTSFSNIHHPDLYFPDGNFVIIAQDGAKKTNRVHFRVHQSILGKHSQVFKDMFALPGSPEDAQELYDGVPFVEVNDDPGDMAKFLTILYEPFIPPIAKDEPDAAFTMFSMLKFADKYMVEPLKELIMSHIRFDWPKSLPEWDKRQEEYSARFKRQNESEPRRWAPDPASVIQVVRSYDPTLLPLVFYQLSTLRRENVGDAREVFRDPPSTTARWTLLSQQDELCIERGRLAMMIWIVNKFDNKNRICNMGIRDCPLPAKTRLVRVHRRIMKNADPLEMLEMLTKMDADGVCKYCDKTWKSSIPPIRAALFDSLSSFFPTE